MGWSTARKLPSRLHELALFQQKQGPHQLNCMIARHVRHSMLLLPPQPPVRRTQAVVQPPRMKHRPHLSSFLGGATTPGQPHQAAAVPGQYTGMTKRSATACRTKWSATELIRAARMTASELLFRVKTGAADAPFFSCNGVGTGPFPNTVAVAMRVHPSSL